MTLVMAYAKEVMKENGLADFVVTECLVIVVDIAVALDKDEDRKDLRATIVFEVFCGDSTIDREILDL